MYCLCRLLLHHCTVQHRWWKWIMMTTICHTLSRFKINSLECGWKDLNLPNIYFIISYLLLFCWKGLLLHSSSLVLQDAVWRVLVCSPAKVMHSSVKNKEAQTSICKNQKKNEWCFSIIHLRDIFFYLGPSGEGTHTTICLIPTICHPVHLWTWTLRKWLHQAARWVHGATVLRTNPSTCQSAFIHFI